MALADGAATGLHIHPLDEAGLRLAFQDLAALFRLPATWTQMQKTPWPSRWVGSIGRAAYARSTGRSSDSHEQLCDGRGRAAPLGATFDGEGVNFAVFSENASSIWVCLFDDGTTEIARLPLPERVGGVWHGYVAGLRPGSTTGCGPMGPTRRCKGHRFNVNKLLIDPYAKR
jgi:hypothetical protein